MRRDVRDDDDVAGLQAVALRVEETSIPPGGRLGLGELRTARAVVSFEFELAELDAKENRLFDRLDAGTIDGPTFKSQQERLRAERAVHLEKMKTAQGAADDEYLVTADRVLELAKSAKNLWSQRSERERVDLLSRVVSNPRLEGKNVLFSLKKPFAALAKMRESGEWLPQRDWNVADGAVG